MSDLLEQLKKEKIKTILRRGETNSEHYLYCPYCAHEQSDIWDSFDLQPNGEDREGQCQKCERHFFYSIELAFSSRKGR